MVAEIKLINVSGTIGNFIGSHAVAVTMLVGVSGAAFIPLRCDSTGALFTSGT